MLLLLQHDCDMFMIVIFLIIVLSIHYAMYYVRMKMSLSHKVGYIFFYLVGRYVRIIPLPGGLVISSHMVSAHQSSVWLAELFVTCVYVSSVSVSVGQRIVAAIFGVA